MPKHPEIILEWEAPEFRHYPKNAAWYITLGILVALLVIYQIFRQDWFGAISIALIAVFVFIFARHEPKIIPVVISDKGIHWGKSYVPYTHIRHFWIIDNDRHKVLNIETTAYLNHELSIELADQDPEFIREVLNELLPEHENPKETLHQRIGHRFKF